MGRSRLLPHLLSEQEGNFFLQQVSHATRRVPKFVDPEQIIAVRKEDRSCFQMLDVSFFARYNTCWVFHKERPIVLPPGMCVPSGPASRALWPVFSSLLLALEKMMSYHPFFTFSSQTRISDSCSWWK